MKVKLPWCIWLFVAILFAFVLCASFFPTYFEKIVPHSQFIILALTLLALLYYAYHTHRLANISAKTLELNIKPIFDIQRDRSAENIRSPICIKVDNKGNYPVYFLSFKVKLEAEDQDGKKIDPIEREFPEKEFWAQKEDAARTLCISMGDNFDYLRNRYARTMKATITVIYQDVADNVYRMNKELEYEI